MNLSLSDSKSSFRLQKGKAFLQAMRVPLWKSWELKKLQKWWELGKWWESGKLQKLRSLQQRDFLGQKGQMALFVALIFQVLFVLFSMVVNVGLLIHHKINLQNSVDLAAYYGAQKQAEMLNALAHINYQIRQSWKLLSWRVRVDGSVGYYMQGPGRGFLAYGDINQDNKPYTLLAEVPPFTCVSHPNGWLWESGDPTNWCYRPGLSVPRISVSEVIGGLSSGAAFANAVLSRSDAIAFDRIQQDNCEAIGRINWRTAALYLVAYRLEQAMRKEALYLLAHNLSRNLQHGGGILDVKGGSVYEGMFKTLKKNLSSANRKGLTRARFFNSLSSPRCRGTSSREKPPHWLSEINVIPLVLYAESICGGPSSIIRLKLLSEGKSRHANNSNDESLDILAQESSGLLQSSLGVEKNPWCMAYTGVEVSTKPRVPFSPFGAISLRARAFAKPFGGRMGPWFHAKWPRDSFFSKGESRTRTDPHLPPRIISGDPPPDDPRDFRTTQQFIPNYSRYVGDPVGLKSLFFLNKMLEKVAFSSKSKQWHDWAHILEGKGLLISDLTNSGNRNLEIANVAPNLFDAHYYSIQPDFFKVYWPSVRHLLQTQLGYRGIDFVPLLPDLGYAPPLLRSAQ